MKGGLLLSLLLASLFLYAQEDNNSVLSTQPVYHDVSGSPYYVHDWSAGLITFSSGRKTTEFRIRFDCVQNLVLLEFKGTSFAAQSKISSFELWPVQKRKVDTLRFQRGFPPQDRRNEETFYRVIISGKVSLLELPAKKILEEPQLASKLVYRRIQDDPQYFIGFEGQLYPVSEAESLIARVYPGQEQQVLDYIKANHVNLQEKEGWESVIRHFANH